MSVPPDRLGWRQSWLARYRRYELLVRLIFLQLRLRRKIVVALRRAGLGDVIASLPACRELARRHSDRVLVYVTHPAFAPVLELAGFPIRVLTAGTGDLPDLSRFFFPSHRLMCADDFYRRPTVNFVVDFAAACGISLPDDERPELHPPPELLRRTANQASALAQGRPVIVFHTGPTDKVREFPTERWHELIALLLQTNAFIVQLGTTLHTRWGENDQAGFPGVHSLVNRLSLAETAAWIARSDLFVGIDSGLLQMAVAVGCPAVAITGPTDMKFRFPSKVRAISVRAESLPCIGCHHHVPRLHWYTGCPFDILCMRQLPPADIFAAVQAQLGRNRAPG